MTKFSIDFTEAKEIVICGKGEHNFKIVNAELKEYIKDGEKRQKIELTCEVFGGEDSGAKVFHSLFLKSPTSLFMFMNRIGAKVEKRNYNLDTTVFIGKTFIANVDLENYKKSNGSIGTKSIIVDTSIRKYIEDSANDELPDAFEEFANEVEISDDDLPFN